MGSLQGYEERVCLYCMVLAESHYHLLLQLRLLFHMQVIIFCSSVRVYLYILKFVIDAQRDTRCYLKLQMGFQNELPVDNHHWMSQ